MKNGWTSERKTKQAATIQNWKPWTQSTGPKTGEGKATVSHNAYKGGKRPALRQSMQKLRAALSMLKHYEDLVADL